MECTPNRVESFYGRKYSRTATGGTFRRPISPAVLQDQYSRKTMNQEDMYSHEFLTPQTPIISPSQDRNEVYPFDSGKTNEFSECDTPPCSSRKEMRSIYSSEVARSDDNLKELIDICLKQTADIKKILKSQDKQEKDIAELKTEVKILKEEKKKNTTTTKNISRDFSKKVSNLHDNLEMQFNPEESSTSKHNKEVAANIAEEIHCDPDNHYSLDMIKLAVKRKYEYLRRTTKEGDCGAVKRMKVSKYDQRKQRAFLRRKSVVLPDEKVHFEKLSKEYMTDESDGDSDVIILHKHEWRSTKVNEWMNQLDKRYKRKRINANSCTPSKQRRVGNPSVSVPPAGAPEWAVCPNWRKQGNEERNAAEKETEDVLFEL